MKKYIYAFWLFFVPFLPSEAQTVKELFAAMPDSLCPLLTQTNRLDCIDFIEAGMQAKVTNRFDGTSILDSLKSDWLSMRTSSNSLLQMKLLPLNDSVKVICMVQTVCFEACDSRVRFFSTDWQELQAASFIDLPKLDDFFKPATEVSSVDSLLLCRAGVDMELVRADLLSYTDQIVFVLTAPDYADTGQAAFWKTYLKESLPYRWSGGRFVPLS